METEERLVAAARKVLDEMLVPLGYEFEVTVNCGEEGPELMIVPLRLTALDDGTDYRPVLAGEDDAQRIVSRILKRSSNMSGFVNGAL